MELAVVTETQNNSAAVLFFANSIKTKVFDYNTITNIVHVAQYCRGWEHIQNFGTAVGTQC